ncbi:GMC family oxidoreductase [Streptosporangium sandarakinum]|uniref:GMC family oxidoreductase n=1 Tax=Streptosporangium sandarakinum TaxID=1260955 RepID=UPI00341A1248
MTTEEFDYVVVGAGAAGSVLTRRLVESGEGSVLLLEAGGSWIPSGVDAAPLWFTLLGSDIDWDYRSVPQPGLGGRSTHEPRGKVIGGSSNLYIMMHIRGHQSDFDNWAYQGAAGWSYADVLPYFQRLEDQEDKTWEGTGSGGPQTVVNAGLHDPNPYSRTFLDACAELGHPIIPDFNGPAMAGAGWHHINAEAGRRRSAMHCFVEPILNDERLTLRPRARATRLLFEGDRCVGVEYAQEAPAPESGEGRRLAGRALDESGGTGLRRVRARREVIVCAGAIESPKLLMLSGIGDPGHLREAGVEVRHPLPGVGANFHNHVLTGVIRETREAVPPGANNLSEAALFTFSQSGLPTPDLQIAFVHVPFDIIVGQNHPNAVSILPGVVRPASRGWVRLASADPFAPPLVNPNYLGDRSDVDRLVQGVELAREIFATRAFGEVLGDELLPGPAAADREALTAFVRERADTYHHQVGSCRMGTDDDAVVDPRLRVRGVEGLRVADASVMPAVTSGNTHAAIQMIAERCADFVLGGSRG